MRTSFLLATIATLATAGPFEHGGFAPNLQCPLGYNLQGKKCEQLITAQPNIHCPLGQLVNEQCILRAPLIHQCPLGSIENGKECAVVESVTPKRFCPPGFADEGRECTKQTPLPLVAHCEIGHEDGSGECVQLEIAQKVIRTFCPSGFYDEGKGCMKVTEYDCSPLIVGKQAVLPVLPVLPYGHKHKNGGYGHRRMLGAKKFNVYAPIPIPVPILAPSKAMVVPLPILPPPPKIQVIRQLCQRKDFAPPTIETFCPDGFTEVGKKCQHVTRYPRVQMCSNGAAANACFDIQAVAKEIVCTKGVLVNDICQYKQPIPRETVCPAGTHPAGLDCEQITVPLMHCPPGTAAEGRICVGRKFAEPTGTIQVTCTGKGCWNQ